MGTQQILMIVLSFIVVGAAIAVGIHAFDTQSNNLSRMAIVNEIAQYGVQAQAWYRTPRMMGGGAGIETVEVQHLPLITSFISHGATGTTIRTDSGVYELSIGASLQIVITGTALSNPEIVVVGAITLRGPFLDDNRGIVISPFGVQVTGN
jgi:hypothetical protein